MNLPLKLQWQTNSSFNAKQAAKTIYAAQSSFPKDITKTYQVKLKTMDGCTLGISNYPYFNYNPIGGGGKGIATPTPPSSSSEEAQFSVNFDPDDLSIPPLSSSTTRFLGLPFPPFLKIEIIPELFKGNINVKSGKVDIEFKAKFLFSVGSIYRPPPLIVVTVLTSDDSKGMRLDEDGKCRLVGVATVHPIEDLFINTFLQLPTQCVAILNALISVSLHS